MADLTRRLLMGHAASGVLAGAARPPAPEPEVAVIGWPADLPDWSATLTAPPEALPLARLIFDQPLDLDPALNLVPSVVRAWELAPDGRAITLDLRDDVVFHTGDRLTSADLQWSLPGHGSPADPTGFWPHLVAVETPTATRAILRFDMPVPGAPIRLAAGLLVLPQAYMKLVGAEAFAARPIGTGPYKLVEAQSGGRLLLERNDAYWGPRPKLRRLAVDIIHEPALRAAAVEAGRVDLTVDVPLREVPHPASLASLTTEQLPTTRIILLQMRDDQGFAYPDIRRAAHLAIDKKALSQTVFGGTAIPISLPAAPGTPGYAEGYGFAYDPALAKQLLAKSGHGPDRPARIRFGTSNGLFPGDYDIARALLAMWQAVGIAAELEAIEPRKYAELNRQNYLPDATLFTWDNPTGAPELYAGVLLDPALPYAAWKGGAFGQRVRDLAGTLDDAARLAGWRALNRDAVEAGALIPLLQAMRGVVRKKTLGYTRYRNGWVLGQTLSWSGP